MFGIAVSLVGLCRTVSSLGGCEGEVRLISVRRPAMTAMRSRLIAVLTLTLLFACGDHVVSQRSSLTDQHMLVSAHQPADQLQTTGGRLVSRTNASLVSHLMHVRIIYSLTSYQAQFYVGVGQCVGLTPTPKILT